MQLTSTVAANVERESRGTPALERAVDLGGGAGGEGADANMGDAGWKVGDLDSRGSAGAHGVDDPRTAPRSRGVVLAARGGRVRKRRGDARHGHEPDGVIHGVAGCRACQLTARKPLEDDGGVTHRASSQLHEEGIRDAWLVAEGQRYHRHRC